MKINMPHKRQFNVVITDCDFASIDIEKKELESIAKVTLHHCRTGEEVIHAAHDADGILVQYAPITKRVIASLSKCRVISRYGIGIDMIDVQAATEYGIPVVNVPDYCVEEVSDHAVALMFACVRKLFVLDHAVRNGKWDVRIAEPLYRFKDNTLGLIGFGNIARRITQKLQSFGCRILVYDPYVPSDVLKQYPVQAVNFEDFLTQSDIISIHSPLTKETRGMFGEKEFRLMKETAYIVNTSRGEIIDERALYKALKGRWIAGAGLDVAAEEPLPANNELLTVDNCIVTPHAAFYSVKSLKDLQRYTARAVAQVLRGEVPAHPVNKVT
jgi:D-3-phosphoglycerate dehydrogenase